MEPASLSWPVSLRLRRAPPLSVLLLLSSWAPLLLAGAVAPDFAGGAVDQGDAGERRLGASSASSPWEDGYSEQEATDMAYIAAAEGCKGDLSAWGCGQCQKTPGMTDIRRQDDDEAGTHAMVGKYRGRCLLAFRGTDSVPALMADLRSVNLAPLPGCSSGGEQCMVGEGFLTCYRTLEARIKSDLEAIGCTRDQPLIVTGHSLGGCLTMLALYDFKASGWNVAKGYTFGQPRVGNAAFAAAFEEALAGASVFRVTNAEDPVPHLLARGLFQHFGTEVFYWDAQTYQICEESEDPTCSIKHESSLLLPGIKCAVSKYICGHRTYFPLEEPLPPLLLHCMAQVPAPPEQISVDFLT